MSNNNLIYPMRYMRITQTYTGSTSHKEHTTGEPKDYPFDEGGKDTGRDWIYCPCEKMTVKRIFGVGVSGVNTIWLESEKKVTFADGSEDYFTFLITHPNDDDLRKIKVGQSFGFKEKICREGKDGASGNHLHISAGKGRFKFPGWMKNSKGKWVLTTSKGAFRPEDLFFIDESFTKVLSKNGLNFAYLKNKKTYPIGLYKVTAKTTPLRKSAGEKAEIKKFDSFTKDAKEKILKLNGGKKFDGYVKGVIFSVSKVTGEYGKTPSGWIFLKDCEVLKN